MDNTPTDMQSITITGRVLSGDALRFIAFFIDPPQTPDNITGGEFEPQPFYVGYGNESNYILDSHRAKIAFGNSDLKVTKGKHTVGVAIGWAVDQNFQPVQLAPQKVWSFEIYVQFEKFYPATGARYYIPITTLKFEDIGYVGKVQEFEV
jgi:hypothetical protein